MGYYRDRCTYPSIHLSNCTILLLPLQLEQNMFINSSSFLLVLPSLQEWDQVSAYSNRSIPRPRIYSTDHQGIADDLRSHISHFSGMGGGMVATKPGKARSIADGQSQHSVSNHSHRGYLNSAFPTNLVNSRPGEMIKEVLGDL